VASQSHWHWQDHKIVYRDIILSIAKDRISSGGYTIYETMTVTTYGYYSHLYYQPYLKSECKRYSLYHRSANIQSIPVRGVTVFIAMEPSYLLVY